MPITLNNSVFYILEIKLTANTQLDDPRKSSECYVVKKNEGKETITAVRGIDVDIAPIPLEKSSYDLKSIKIPEALKEKPVTDDLVNEIYKDIDNPLLNDSVESGEIPCDPQDIVHRYEIKSVSNTKADSTKTDSINANNQQPLASYRIPKLKICRSFTQSDKSVAVSTKRDDDNKSNDVMSVSKKNSKSVPKIHLDLKNDDVNVKDKALISKHMPLPLLSSHTDKSNHDHIKTKAAMKMVEDDLELSDETCDTDMYKTKEKTTKNNDTSSVKRDYKTETKITSKTKCDADNSQGCKDVNIASDNDKKVKAKKRQHKQKNTPEEVKSKICPTEKHTKKKVKEKEVKTKEIKTKFSELFGDSSSLISPEDLGLIAVQPPLNQPVAGIFEDAQDAVDVNVKETSVNSETMVDTTIVEAKKSDDKKTEKVNIELSSLINKTDEVTAENPDPLQKNDVPIQSIYENLEVGPKPEEANVKTVIISTGVQPTTSVFNKPIIKNLDQLELPVKPPEQIDLKALATSTPLKLDVQNLPLKNPQIIETNGNTNNIRNESTDNDTDVSNSNIDSKMNETDVPDIRMFVKRRRKVLKK